MINKFLKTKFGILAICFALALPSCDNDLKTVSTTTTSLGTQSEDTDFIILVRDENNDPLQGAHVTLGGTNFCTTEDGILAIRNLTIAPEGRSMTVTAPGYLTTLGYLQSVNSGDNFVVADLVKQSDATTPVTNKISLKDDIQLTYPDTLSNIDGENIPDASMSAISYLQSTELGPHPPKLSTDSDGNISLIETEVVITIGTYDANNNELSLLRDSTIELSIENLNASDDSLFVYNYNEATESWDQSEFIFKPKETNENDYTGKISIANGHIALGKPVNPTILLFKAIDQDEVCLNNLPYFINDNDSDKYLASGYTDQNGFGKALVPSNKNLSIVPYINKILGDPVDEQDTIELAVDGTLITGSVQLCTTTPDSAAIINYEQGEDLLFAFAKESNFNVTLLQDGQAIFQGYDPSLFSKSDEVVVPNPNDGDDIGALILCESLETNATITVNTNITENTLWRNCNTYILDGLIYVDPGATLTIEEGTLIKATENQSDQASGLVIPKGAKLMANGTSSRPIIFTSVLDEITENQIISPNLDESNSALWAGLIILGDAPVSTTITPAVLDGLDASDPLNYYGGEIDDDDSGSLSFISIRHAGGILSGGNSLAGLTIAGVGSGSDIGKIEVVGAGVDGLSLHGGSVSIDDIAILSPGEDGIDIRQSYSGTLSNAIIILGASTDYSFNMKGGESTLKNSAVITDFSCKGSRALTSTPGHYFILQEEAKGTVTDSYFFGFSESSEAIIGDSNSADNYAIDSLIITNIAIDTTGLVGGNKTVELIFSDQSGMEVFTTKPTNTQLVELPTFGASINGLTRWTFTDATGKLDDF